MSTSIQSEVALTTASAASLADVGVGIDEARPPGIEQTFELVGRLFGADGGAGVNMLLHMAGTTEPSPLLMRLGASVQQFAAGSAAEFGGVLAQLDIYRATMLSFFDRYDAILCPVNPLPAPLHGTTFDDDHLPGFSYTMAYNLTGWPSVVVRGGTSPEGLPIWHPGGGAPMARGRRAGAGAADRGCHRRVAAAEPLAAARTQSTGPRKRQNGCPAGSSSTRTYCCGWWSASVAPASSAQPTAASTSSTAMSRCIIICGSPGAGGQTGAT
jgi:hypothetical protein